MVGILSIDFDYFIDVTADERERFFPDGFDEMPPDRLNAMWEERYARFPELKDVGVTDDFYFMKNFLMLLNVHNSYIFKSDSHKNIIRLAYAVPETVKLRVVNIDFHHDYYHFYRGNDYCNCGNWLRRLLEKRPDTSVKWIRRDDSQICSLEGEFPFEHSTDIKSVSREKFNYIFICRSPEWSPPHLGREFDSLFLAATRGRPA